MAYAADVARWKPDAQGRLMQAALTLFAEQGYEETTVAQIAESAGLTKRTFFRYFADKREVLFDASHQLQDLWVAGLRAAPDEASPMAAVFAGLDDVATMFVDRHAFARKRATVVAANPELQERELIKLHTLTDAIAAALVDRGVSPNGAVLAGHAGVTVFHVAFGRWVRQDDPSALRALLDVSLTELREVTAA